MDATPETPQGESNRTVILLVFLGLLIIVFAFGKSLIDLAVLPDRIIDLEADDQLLAGFLPVYEGEGQTANAEVVAVGLPPAQPFPTPQTAELEPTPAPGEPPDRLVIPAIELDTEVIPIGYEAYQFEGDIYHQWLAPDFRAAGWHETSVGLGVPGNTVLNGHHNIKGEVFRDVYRLQVGDELIVYSGDVEFNYVVVFTAILEERNQPLEVRLANAEWIQSTEDERVTLITCWPYESNTHRVVVVAIPVREEGG